MPRNFGLWISISIPVRALSRRENIIESLSTKILETMLDPRDRSRSWFKLIVVVVAVLKKWDTRGNFFFPPERIREKQEGRCRVRLIFHIKSVQREFSREKQSRALVSTVHR